MTNVECAKVIIDKLFNNAINNPSDNPSDTANFLTALSILQSADDNYKIYDILDDIKITLE